MVVLVSVHPAHSRLGTAASGPSWAAIFSTARIPFLFPYFGLSFPPSVFHGIDGVWIIPLPPSRN